MYQPINQLVSQSVSQSVSQIKTSKPRTVSTIMEQVNITERNIKGAVSRYLRRTLKGEKTLLH